MIIRFETFDGDLLLLNSDHISEVYQAAEGGSFIRMNGSKSSWHVKHNISEITQLIKPRGHLTDLK